MASSEDLKPCPAGGKQAGELIEDKTSRFPSPIYVLHMGRGQWFDPISARQ